MTGKATRLNLGCGDVFLPSWANFDFVARPPHVVRHDLRTRLPLPDAACAVVYHSHVLEHFDPAEAQAFLAECLRVLQPGGILRVVIPDLEQKARHYLGTLEAAAQHPAAAEAGARHEWMTLELIDQLVRRQAGGHMAPFMRTGQCREWVSARIGDEYAKANAASAELAAPRPARRRLGVRTFFRNWLQGRARARLGLTEEEVAEARFRQTGELHRWMYDRITLTHLLQRMGFAGISVSDAGSSGIENWAEDGQWLDIGPGGPRRPDSLYVEARRP